MVFILTERDTELADEGVGLVTAFDQRQPAVRFNVDHGDRAVVEVADHESVVAVARTDDGVDGDEV